LGKRVDTDSAPFIIQEQTSLVGKRVDTDSGPFIIQEQQAEWVNAQRQILRPLSFRNSKLGGKRAKANFAPFVIQKQQVERWAETNYGHSAHLFAIQRRSFPVAHRNKLWSFCV